MITTFENKREREESQNKEKEEEENEYELLNVDIDKELKKQLKKEKNNRSYLYCSTQFNHKLILDKKYSIQSYQGSKYGSEFDVRRHNSDIPYTLTYHSGDSSGWINYQQVYQHIILSKFFDFENISKVCDICFPQFPQSLNSFYFISEGMDIDLGSLIRSNTAFTQEHIQFFMFLLVRALYQVHTAKVTLTKITPLDISIMQNCDLRLKYFHEARSFEDNILGLDNYISERNYISPETLIERQITAKSNIWSAGCIFAELLLRRRLFGYVSEYEYLKNIIQFCGPLHDEDKSFIKNEKAIVFIQGIKEEAMSMESTFPAVDPICLDLLRNMLLFNPDKRFDALKCLQHAYFEDLYAISENEPQKTEFDWKQFEGLEKLSEEQIQLKLYQESLYYKQEH